MGIFRKRSLRGLGEKKKDMPEGLWQKCPSCVEVIYEQKLSKNQQVCPECGHHFTLAAPERIAAIADPDTFEETDAGLASGDPLKFEGYPDKAKSSNKRSGLTEAVITGRAQLGGTPTILGIMDFRFMGGSMGSVVGEKITRAIELATAEGKPVILFSASGGARMHEGILSLMQMAKTSAALARHDRAKLPFISVLTHPTTGGVTASFATLGDVILAEPGCLIGFAGARVIKETTHQTLPEGFQTAEFMVEHGLVDRIVDRASMRDELIAILGYLAPGQPRRRQGRSMNYAEATGWLFGAQAFGIKLGLDNTRRLLAELGLPPEGCRFLHVAGTNGKGSTCAIAESVLRAGGTRTGLFTSPHLIRFNERARVAGAEMPDAAVAKTITRIRDLVEGWDPHPTFFEMTLAIALLHFRQEDCQTVVLETGMGGRLDATSAIHPAACAITPIALDHQNWLGDDLATIAGEKAGILKPHVPAVSAPQPPEAAGILRSRAAELPCPLTFLQPGEERAAGCQLGLAGPHQRQNAELALALLDAAGMPPTEDATTAGLRDARWPARFDRRPAGPGKTLVIDGAHNPHAAASLALTWEEEYPGQKVPVVFAGVEGKDTAAVLQNLAPIASRFLMTRTDSHRALPPEDLAALTPTASEIVPDPPTAITAALSGSDLALLTGSLFLAGRALAHLEKLPLQASSQ